MNYSTLNDRAVIMLCMINKLKKKIKINVKINPLVLFGRPASRTINAHMQ